MENNLLRLKTDILNDLRNEKYYVIDELQKLADSTVMPQREKVHRAKENIKNITLIDLQISTTETIFVDEESEDQSPSDEEPNNVIESSVNEQGQSHSE